MEVVQERCTSLKIYLKEHGNRTVFRVVDGKFKIDSKLTEELTQSWEQAKKDAREEASKVRMTNIDYVVKGVYEDDLEVINKDTGEVLGLSKGEFYPEQAEVLKEGMILNYKDNKYITKNIEVE